jgi:hypothetical protein
MQRPITDIMSTIDQAPASLLKSYAPAADTLFRPTHARSHSNRTLPRLHLHSPLAPIQGQCSYSGDRLPRHEGLYFRRPRNVPERRWNGALCRRRVEAGRPGGGRIYPTLFFAANKGVGQNLQPDRLSLRGRVPGRRPHSETVRGSTPHAPYELCHRRLSNGGVGSTKYVGPDALVRGGEQTSSDLKRPKPSRALPCRAGGETSP